MAKAKDIMTKNVVLIKPDTSVYDAIIILVDKQISGMPVVNDKNELVGVVTEQDFLVYFDFVGNSEVKKALVKDYMTRETVQFKPDSDVSEILRAFVQKNIKRVPITNENDEVVGVVSRRDVLKYMANK
ncbi:MAG: CBS domain-containing protein [Candidatus Omnitrophica bacterium]|nr:CBS domain-containing protein [Candidatus Omnitrophota bacterium]